MSWNWFLGVLWSYWDNIVKEIKSCWVISLFVLKALFPGCSGSWVIKEIKTWWIRVLSRGLGDWFVQEFQVWLIVGWRIRPLITRSWLWTWSRIKTFVSANFCSALCWALIRSCWSRVCSSCWRRSASSGSRLNEWGPWSTYFSLVSSKACTSVCGPTCVGVRSRRSLTWIAIICWVLFRVCLSKLQFALKCSGADSLGKEHACNHRLKHFIILTVEKIRAF